MIFKLIVKICKLSCIDIPDTVYTNAIITLQQHKIHLCVKLV